MKSNNKRYYADVLYNGGEETVLVVKAESQSTARDKLFKNYKIDSVLRISDTYINADNRKLSYYGSGRSLLECGANRRNGIPFS